LSSRRKFLLTAHTTFSGQGTAIVIAEQTQYEQQKNKNAAPAAAANFSRDSNSNSNSSSSSNSIKRSISKRSKLPFLPRQELRPKA
jgi:hypothetical protein